MKKYPLWANLEVGPVYFNWFPIWKLCQIGLVPIQFRPTGHFGRCPWKCESETETEQEEKSWTRGHQGAVEDPAPGVGGFSGEEEDVEEEEEIKVRRRRRQRPSCSATVRWRPCQVAHPFRSPPNLLFWSPPNLLLTSPP